MIQIFDIKKAKANKKINTNDKEILEEYIKISNTGNDKIFKQLDTTEAGNAAADAGNKGRTWRPGASGDAGLPDRGARLHLNEENIWIGS